MAKLKLRVDFVDNSNPLQPNRPTGFTVVGFTCASMAIIRLDPDRESRWLVYLAPTDEPLERLPRSFGEPESALLHIQEWLDNRDSQAEERATASPRNTDRTLCPGAVTHPG